MSNVNPEVYTKGREKCTHPPEVQDRKRYKTTSRLAGLAARPPEAPLGEHKDKCHAVNSPVNYKLSTEAWPLFAGMVCVCAGGRQC